MTDRHATAPRPEGADELVFAALGGLGEIGMNCYVYGLGPPKARQWLVVDLGITFPGEAEPGVDVVLPDLSFLLDQRPRIAGLVLTHAHEDHVGAVLDLAPSLNVPIYATAFTAGMVNSKVAEFGTRAKLDIRVVKLGERFQVGPFDVELVTMSHSIPEPSGLALRTRHGLVFHTGDWKFDSTPLVGDPHDQAKLEALGAEGVAAIVCDSTNAFREGRSPSEVAVAESLTKIVKAAKRRVAVTTFASNVARIKAVADAARASGRRLVVSGRAMHRVIQVAIETGYLPADFRALDQDQFSYLGPDEALLLCTGSQGEPRAAISRIAEDEHPDIQLGAGDLVIFSSRTIPGNERAVGRVQNNLARLGCEVVTDSEALVHVTGHPRREELRQLYGLLKPSLVVPMHGEARHLRENARLAKATGVAEVRPVTNGQLLRIAPGKPEVVATFSTGRLFRDGRLIVSDADGPVRQRRKLAVVGIVAIALLIGRKGELLADPLVELDGVPAETGAGYPMEDQVLDAIEATLKSISPQRRRNVETVQEAVRRAVRSAVDEAWGKKPIVKVMVLGGQGN